MCACKVAKHTSTFLPLKCILFSTLNQAIFTLIGSGKKKDVSAFRHDHDTVVTTQKIVIIVTLMSKMKART